MNSDKTLDTIKKTVHDFLQGAEVILFGSRARGDERMNSDYDLLIIVETPVDVPSRLLFQSKIRKSLARQNILADVILQSRSDIEIKKNLSGHIVRTAIIEGIRV